MAGPRYRPGDPWVICDRTGFKVRMSETVKEWTGLRVRREDWEPRHPQDFVRGRKDVQAVQDPRPEAPNDFIAAPGFSSAFSAGFESPTRSL